MKPVISPRTRRSTTVFTNASTAPAATCTRIGAGGQNERSGQRRASQTTSGVKAAHTHHSPSCIAMVRRQLPARPVDT